MSCPLCNLEKLTKWHYETENFIVCTCLTCGIPMYVWKKHSFPNPDEIEEMVLHAREYFPGTALDFMRRTVSNHYHFHCRKGK